MTRWKPASAVFHGGTQQLLSLRGHRVRTRVPLLQMPINGAARGSPQTLDVPVGSVGLLANPLGEDILIAFPALHGAPLTTLDALMRSTAFNVVRINWPTFRAQFEVEA